MEMQEWKGCRLQFHYILYIIYQEKYCFRDPPRKADETILKTFDENEEIIFIIFQRNYKKKKYWIYKQET